jgi:uncharacterized protein
MTACRAPRNPLARCSFRRTVAGMRAVACAAAVSLSWALCPLPGAHVAASSLQELRQRTVVTQRFDLSCGAAALATLLTHDLDDPVSERAVAEAMVVRTDPGVVRAHGGFSLLDLQQFAERRGYEATGYGVPSLEDLAALAPAIVPVKLHGYDHFVVFRGVRGDHVVLADPAFGRRVAAVREFERAWAIKVALVVVPPAEAPDGDEAGEGGAEPDDEATADEDEPETDASVDAASLVPARRPRDAAESEDDAVFPDADATRRALERALVRQSGMVLRPWTADVEPEADYAYREASALRRDTLTTAMTLRLGLPWATQAEVRVPWVLLDRQSGAGTGSGLGDAELAVTKQLVARAAGGSTPDLLLGMRWKTATGASRAPLAPGSGAHAVQAALTAVTRDDPLVLVGTLSYSWNLPSRGVDLGDAATVLLRVLLAATPNTSLLLGLDVTSTIATRVEGRPFPETARLGGTLDVGLSTVVGRDLLLNVTAGLGITPAAPPFQLAIALPLRL